MKIIFKKASEQFKTSLILGLLLVTGLSAQAQEKTLMAISNQTGAPTTMKLSELKAVLTGEKDRWKSGNRVLLALMKTNTPLGKQVAETVYDMSGDQLNRFWLGLVFQGKAQAPNFFSSLAELEKFVAENPGAIGISNRNPTSEEIRLIPIDGEKTF